MEHIELLKNAVDFLLHDIRRRQPKTMDEIKNNLEVWKQYEELMGYLNDVDAYEKTVVPVVNLFAVKKLLDTLFEGGVLSVRAKQIAGSLNYVGEVSINDVSTPAHLMPPITWPGEYSNPDDAINNLKTMLGITK